MHLRSLPRSLITAVSVVAAIALLPGCSNPFAGGSNVEPPAPLTEYTPTATITTVWSRSVGAGAGKRYLRLRPAVQGDRVFAAESDGDVSAYDVATGEELWETTTDTPVSGGPGVGDDLVVVGTSDGEVLALKADSGEIAWRRRVTSEVLAAPAVGQGVVVVRSQDGKIAGLAASDGTHLWTYDRAVPALSLRGTSSPVVDDHMVVAGLDSGLLVALSVKDGALIWESRIAIPSGRSELERLVDIDADPVVTPTVIYVVTYQGRVAAVERITGRLEWRRDMSSHAGLGLSRRQIFISDSDSYVWAIDWDNSASIWRQDNLLRRSLSPPTAFGAYVAVGDFEGYIHLLDRDDGRLAARARVDSDGLASAPVAVGDLLLVYGRGGTLTALRAE